MTATLNKAAHVRYHLRCLKTLLPTAYATNDSQRMTLAFFTLCALDLLEALTLNTTNEERSGYTDWIYGCQHSDGGFRGFTGAEMGARKIKENEHWDPANIAATYFALASLAILGDDLGRVNRKECLRWLKRLQLHDGTFGEALGFGGEVQGGRDMRFCYCAAAIRWILGGEREAEEDVNVDRMMRFLEASQTYEGGFANGPFHEAHAGWTSCAVGAMSLLGKLRHPTGTGMERNIWPSIEPINRLLGWLVSRQTSVQQEEDYSVPVETEAKSPTDPDDAQLPLQAENASLVAQQSTLQERLGIEPSDDDLQFAGFTGRCNKAADTCYAFWAGGSLAILNSLHLIDQDALRRYLLTKTQHQIGGFGKLPGDPPGELFLYISESVVVMRQFGALM